MTLRDLSLKSGVSQSHLARIEQGGRFPSAKVLRQISRPLGFNEGELFTLAGFLSVKSLEDTDEQVSPYTKINPLVAKMMSQETEEVQLALLGLIRVMKNLRVSVNEPAKRGHETGNAH